jgi:hypothetical protein
MEWKAAEISMLVEKSFDGCVVEILGWTLQ